MNDVTNAIHLATPTETPMIGAFPIVNGHHLGPARPKLGLGAEIESSRHLAAGAVAGRSPWLAGDVSEYGQ